MSLPEHKIAENGYGRYCVPLSSAQRPAARAVLAGEVWESDTLALMRARCGGGDIVHAGTYFGDFLPALASALADGARLWAFEPSRENHACAAHTLALNVISNATLLHAGLGARSRMATIMTAKPNGATLGGSSHMVRREKPGGTYEEIRIVAIDDIVPRERTVSIIQLDVEGSEQAALKGAMETIRKNTPILILESLPKDEDWFAREILSLGYSETGKAHANTVFEVKT